MTTRLCQYLIVILVLLFSFSLAAVQPITEQELDSFLTAQNIDLQRTLEKLLPESQGYLITGPLDPLADMQPNIRALFSTVRVVCPDRDTYKAANQKLLQLTWQGSEVIPDDTPFCTALPGYTGVVFNHRAEGRFQLNTIQQTRFLIWARRVRLDGWNNENREKRQQYARRVSDYLVAIDTGNVDAEPPKAVDYDLPDRFDIYAPDPDYVIQGYQNYKDFLYSYSALKTDFAHGVLAFVPTDETLEQMKRNAPREAYPNKEAAKLQEEYREFFERGGDVRVMQTLTKEGFDTLKTGEYFFAVGFSGKIRFGRELLREEVESIEREAGRKAPRANHAFLFPGEPVLTAGAFFIDERAPSKLIKVNAQSGHYFYSNINESIREDISQRSDHYLLTLGHFFRALDSLGISYDNILISKL